MQQRWYDSRNVFRRKVLKKCREEINNFEEFNGSCSTFKSGKTIESLVKTPSTSASPDDIRAIASPYFNRWSNDRGYKSLMIRRYKKNAIGQVTRELAVTLLRFTKRSSTIVTSMLQYSLQNLILSVQASLLSWLLTIISMDISNSSILNETLLFHFVS